MEQQEKICLSLMVVWYIVLDSHYYMRETLTKVPCCVNMAGSEALKKLEMVIDSWQDRYLAGTSC
jgi:hypothetical protein